MEARGYTSADRASCLAVFDSNLGAGLFTAGDRESFAAFLDGYPGSYCVLDHDGRVIGCGGYRAGPDTASATLEWGMIAREAQRQGIGRYLLLYRMKEIGRIPGIERVLLETPAGAVPFFEKYGFRVCGQGAAGRVQMRMKLVVCA